jgi:hypothetical protein
MGENHGWTKRINIRNISPLRAREMLDVEC